MNPTAARVASNNQPPGPGAGDDDLPTRVDTLIGTASEAAGNPDHEETMDLDLGRFRVLRRLGKGGMGQVFLALQTEPVERQVALKVIHQRLLNPETRARFDVERQSLAQMQHPAIAQIHDAGTTPQGYPFFAMEYIDGEPLDRFCDRHELDPRERLALLIRVCRGVHHAHLKGIVHRDLKPANILVRFVDGTAQPKIIDFGIATAVTVDRDEGRRDVVGTPEYMSPEQFRLDSVSIDARSDVYSLGVIGYKLLAGQAPVDRDHVLTRDSSSWQHAIENEAEPPTPSSRINGEFGEQVARARGTTPTRLRKHLKSDLDAVILKALARDRSLRYESADELAGDLANVLAYKPVSARPDSRRYRTARFLRRHAVAAGSTGAVVLALVAGLTAATIGMMEANHQFEIAEQRQHELEQLAGFQQTMLEDIDATAMGVGIIERVRGQVAVGLAGMSEAGPEAPGLDDLDFLLGFTNAPDLARGIVDEHVLGRARATIEADFADQPLLQADLYSALFAVYAGLGEVPRLPELAERLFELRIGQYPADHPEVLDAHRHLGQAYFRTSDYRQSQYHYDRVIDALSGRPDAIHTLAPAMKNQSITLVEMGETEAALALAQQAVDLGREIWSADEASLLDLIGNVGYIKARSGDVEGALPHFERRLAGQRRLENIERAELARSMTNVAAARAALGHWEQAEAMTRQTLDLLGETLGRRHPDSLRAMNNLANLLNETGALDEAIELLEETLELRAELMGENHPETLRSRLNLASAMGRAGQYAEALEKISAVIDQRRAQLGEHHLDTLMAREIQANTLINSGAPEAALPIITDVHAARAERLGPAHRRTRAAALILAEAALDANQPAAAEAVLTRTLNAIDADASAGSEFTTRLAVDLFEVLGRLERFDAAEQVREQRLDALLAAESDALGDGDRELRERVERLSRQWDSH